MTKRQRESERKTASRILRLAVARAVRGGNCLNNQKELWKIVVDMSHKAK